MGVLNKSLEVAKFVLWFLLNCFIQLYHVANHCLQFHWWFSHSITAQLHKDLLNFVALLSLMSLEISLLIMNDFRCLCCCKLLSVWKKNSLFLLAGLVCQGINKKKIHLILDSTLRTQRNESSSETEVQCLS